MSALAGLVAVVGICAVLVSARTSAAQPSTGAAVVATESTPTATPTPTAVATPLSAAVVHAGQEYLAAVAPLNAAVTNFGAALTRAQSQSCSCPAGEFDAGPAMTLQPTVYKALLNLRDTLQRMRSEAPEYAGDIDASRQQAETEATDLSYAALLFSTHNPGFTGALSGFVAAHRSGTAVAARLRADLGLPPPPGS